MLSALAYEGWAVRSVLSEWLLCALTKFTQMVRDACQMERYTGRQQGQAM